MFFADAPDNIKKAEWNTFASHPQYLEWCIAWLSDLSIKISSKDRMKLIFVVRFVLERFLEIHRVNYVALYHKDVQRKGREGISSTFSPDIYMVFCHIFGDLPLSYLEPLGVAKEPKFQQELKTFDTFTLHALWNL